jgi:glycerol uptake facilitator-like aquaporin
MSSTDPIGLGTRLLSEFAGTFAISFFGPAAIVFGFLVPELDATQRLLFAALVPGVTLAVEIKFLARYSGSHVNPAITVAFSTSGKFRRGLVFPYFAVQFAGGMLAGLAMYLVFDSMVPSASLGSNMVSAGVSIPEAFFLEVVGAMVLCLVVLYDVALVKGAGKQGVVAGIALFILIYLLGPVSGGSMNPVRSLGPAAFSGFYDRQYLYVICPIIGAAVAGLTFRTERGKRLEKPA